MAYQRQVSHEEGVCLASDLNANYFEISSAINTNVQGLFDSLLVDLVEGIRKQSASNEEEVEEASEEEAQEAKTFDIKEDNAPLTTTDAEAAS